MVCGASVMFVALCLYVGFKLKSSSDKEELMFIKELQKIKSDSVLNYIDEHFIERNFEILGDVQFALAANDEKWITYPITDLQDLDPKGFA